MKIYIRTGPHTKFYAPPTKITETFIFIFYVLLQYTVLTSVHCIVPAQIVSEKELRMRNLTSTLQCINNVLSIHPVNSSPPTREN